MVDRMFDAVTLDAFTPRGMMRMAFNMMQQSAETLRALMPGQETRVVWQEFKNKLHAFDLFEHVDSELRLPSETFLPLTELIERVSTLEAYRALWATEGVGHYYAETFWEQHGAPQNLLSGSDASALPATSMTALHAGMGLAFASRLLETVNPESPARKIQTALEQFIALCQDNSRKGYVGATYESLGLVARNLYPQMVQILGRQLSEICDALVAYFWHGVGRAIYFAPTNFPPFNSAPWRGVAMTQREPAHESGRLNALAGLMWAAMLVNIRQPEIVETLLKHHGHELIQSDALSNGASSAVMIWRDSTTDDSYLDALFQYQPGSSDAGLIELWTTQVLRPCQDALQHIYPVLKEQDCLGEAFRYQSLPELVARLKKESSESRLRPVRSG